MKSEEVFTAEKFGHSYAVDMVKQVVNINKGIYLEEDLKNATHTDFCIGVGGYPEKHYEALNMNTDLKYLKAKVDAGAHYIVTQLFFDNNKFFDFVKSCREIGITVPIIPGIKPITTLRQVHNMPRVFYVSFPEELANEFEKCKSDDDAARIGMEWSIHQSKELIKAGFNCLHFYTMSSPNPTYHIVKQLA